MNTYATSGPSSARRPNVSARSSQNAAACRSPTLSAVHDANSAHRASTPSNPVFTPPSASRRYRRITADSRHTASWIWRGPNRLCDVASTRSIPVQCSTRSGSTSTGARGVSLQGLDAVVPLGQHTAGGEDLVAANPEPARHPLFADLYGARRCCVRSPPAAPGRVASDWQRPAERQAAGPVHGGRQWLLSARLLGACHH